MSFGQTFLLLLSLNTYAYWHYWSDSAMNEYTGFQYICIDIANQFGLDKELFPDRIQWVLDNFDILETLESPAKERPLYLKAVMALHDACAGKEIGHLVAFDACNSGAQIMSALTGCIEGAKATNLINTGLRRDGYTDITTAASDILGEGLVIARGDIKNAQMTHLYGSKAEPRGLFGEDTPELAAFYKANWVVFPGANEMLSDTLAMWQPFALAHSWKLPDNFHAYVKVMQTVETRIEIDELDKATCTYEYQVNEGKERDVKMAANLVHSIDAYILRSMQRRCGYDVTVVNNALYELRYEQDMRSQGIRIEQIVDEVAMPHHVYMERFEASRMVDAVLLPHVTFETVCDLTDLHIEKLIDLCQLLLTHKPFDIVTVHDAFACHPNNCNQLRRHYIELFAELAESTVLEDTFLQVCGHKPTYENKDLRLPALIRASEYPLS
jgi:hypothetical protein